MVKVLSFSLWGDNPTYTVGAIRNAVQAKTVYPDFECWFYTHTPSVPEETVETLRAMGNVKIIEKTGDLNTTKPMMWRFEAIDHPSVELFMSRDVDTRILKRELLAVDEWLASDKKLHIMRDHPWHKEKIQGGMFGVKGDGRRWAELASAVVQSGHRYYDQTFLANVIYPMYYSQGSAMIHASFNRFEGDECRPFPITHAEDDYRFVGEYVYADETRNAQNKAEVIRGHL